jgi:hypothetical protein
MMRAVRCSQQVSSWEQRLKSLLRQLYREASLERRRKDNQRLRHIRMSPTDQWMIVVLIILILLGMALGAYLSYIFNGQILEVELRDGLDGSFLSGIVKGIL